jgi:hypothetical protein
MLTKLQSVVAGPGMGMAMGLPIDVTLARIEASAAALRVSAEKAPGGRSGKSFGQMIAKAVKARTAKARIAVFAEGGEEQSFGEKIAEAIKRKTGSRSGTRQQHDKAAEAEGKRYRPLKQRPRTKSE